MTSLAAAPRVLALAAMVAAGAGACGVSTPPAIAEAAADASFRDPQHVTIHGYTGDAMEPFVTRDAQWLLFNSRNDPAQNTDLHYARRRDDLNFDYVGPLAGANGPLLDAVPTMDREGNFYFISTRSYESTLSSIFRGTFQTGNISDVALVDGLPRTRGFVLFDVEVTPDGNTLYYASGRFRGGAVPSAADLAIATRRGNAFEPSAESATVLAGVNTSAALEYAAATGADERELFFTRAAPGSEPGIYRAERAGPKTSFSEAKRVQAIRGFAEAPALAPDGRSLYYHALANSRFTISRVVRDSR